MIYNNGFHPPHFLHTGFFFVPLFQSQPFAESKHLFWSLKNISRTDWSCSFSPDHSSPINPIRIGEREKDSPRFMPTFLEWPFVGGLASNGGKPSRCVTLFPFRQHPKHMLTHFGHWLACLLVAPPPPAALTTFVRLINHLWSLFVFVSFFFWPCLKRLTEGWPIDRPTDLFPFFLGNDCDLKRIPFVFSPAATYSSLSRQ